MIFIGSLYGGKSMKKKYQFIYTIFIAMSMVYADNDLNDTMTKKVVKMPTLEEFQLMREDMHNMDDKKAQEAKKVADYFKTLIEARKEVGVKGTPTREQEMTIMDTLFQMTKKEALKKEKREVFCSQCFVNAKTLNEANICVQEANSILGFITNDFIEWNTKVQQKVIVQIDRYFPCVEKSINVEELNECYIHIYK